MAREASSAGQKYNIGALAALRKEIETCHSNTKI